MNQIVGRKQDGTHFVALVLEPGNLHLLQKGRPVELHLDDFFPEGLPKRLDLEIFYSETPVADARELKKLAEVALDERSAISGTKRPHCPECRSTIEQLGVWKSDAPLAVVFCATCGCVLGLAEKQACQGGRDA